MNVMLLIPVTATPFVWTVMAPSHALASQVSQEMDLIAKVTVLAAASYYIVLLNQNVMLLISVTTILFVWTLMTHSHALAFRVSQEMGSTAKVMMTVIIEDIL